MNQNIPMPKDSAAIASIRASIDTFKDDPPDNDFQRGYLGCLQDLLAQVYEAEQESASIPFQGGGQ